MNVENGGRALELITLMNESAGYAVVGRIQSLSLSTYKSDRNFAELDALFDQLLDPVAGTELMALANRDLLSLAQAEISRRLHNVVAAAQSLIDHTRRLGRQLYAGAEEKRLDYERRVKEAFATDPLSRFVVGLRQYCQHYQLPFVGFTWRFTQTASTHEFSLNRDGLLEFDSWTTEAKAYLDSHGDKIDFRAAISEYRDKVVAFYQWFESDVRAIHADVLAELRASKEEYALIELDASIALAEQTRADSPARRVANLFVQVLQPDEVRQVAGQKSPREQMTVALSLLTRRLQVPEAVPERLWALVDRVEEEGGGVAEEKAPVFVTIIPLEDARPELLQEILEGAIIDVWTDEAEARAQVDENGGILIAGKTLR